MASIIDRTAMSGVISTSTAGVDTLFDDIEKASAVLSMGRNIGTMPKGSSQIPVPTQLITAGFVNGDSGEKPATDTGLDLNNLVAGKIAAIAVVPQDVLDDADIDIWEDWLKPQIPSAFGAALDAAALFGVGKPTEWTGFQAGLVPGAVSAGNTVTKTDDAYADILGVDGIVDKVSKSGFRTNGFVAAPETEAILRASTDKNGRSLFMPFMNPLTGAPEDTLYGKTYMTLDNGAWNDATNKSLLIGGDFKKLIYSIRKEISYKISTEATVKLADGQTVNCYQQNLVAFLMEMRIGAAVLNPAVRGGNGKYPFAVLKNA